MIPEAAVEAAAKAHIGTGDTAWDELAPMVRRLRIQKMRAALDAAAPHMLAKAWEEGCEAMHATTGGEWPLIHEDNPYRHAT